MLNRKEIKDIQSLARKKYRDELKLFIAEGPKIVGELVELIPDRIVKVYATSEWIKANPSLSYKTEVIEISEIELGKVSQLQTPNQVLAVIMQSEGIEPDMSSFILYLDAIQDPGNFGTIIRIADWFNIKHIVCSQGCADVYNPKVVQSTMASIARINVYYHQEDQWLQTKELPIYAAALHGRSLYDHAKVNHGILIIGNESKGIRPELLDLATEKITIPKRGAAESLNAAVATGIILSHLLI
jgi:TrmH family RNA methyltransferase